MPSWSDNLQQDHRWTGRQLIGGEGQTEDESEPDVPLPSGQQHLDAETLGPKCRKRMLMVDDTSSDEMENAIPEEREEEDIDINFQSAESADLSLGSQWQPLPSQLRTNKRTLLTVEELDDSDDGFQEQEEEASMESQVGEQSTAMQQLAITVPLPCAMTTEDAVPEGSVAGDMDGQEDMDAEMQSAHSPRDTPSPQGFRAHSIGSDVAVDSGRALESQGGTQEQTKNRADSLKRKKKAVKYLERICLDLLKQLSDCQSIELKSARGDVTQAESEEDEPPAEIADAADNEAGGPLDSTADGRKPGEISIPLLNRASGELKYLKYPRKPAQSETSTSLPIARLLRVCVLLHEALVTDVIVTKRDIYYKDVNLFGKQNVVDVLVDDIVASVGLKRSDFNVVASAKGLMAASGLGLFVNGMRELVGPNPTLIPSDSQIDGLDASRPPCWVLVIEKEATFTTLCASGILADSNLGEGVLVTGKGYPDFATLHFLRLVADEFPSCPIAILVDADAHGLDILSVYQYGSKGMRFTAETEGLALGERATWLGVKATEWASYVQRRLDMDMDKLVPISEKDQRFAQSMLREEDIPLEWSRQLSHMLHIRRKAEIQNLNNINSTVGSITTCLEPGLATPPDDIAIPAPPSFLTSPVSAPSPVLLPEIPATPGSTPDTSPVKPETRGLYGYVKTRILDLLLPPSNHNQALDNDSGSVASQHANGKDNEVAE